MSRFLQRWLRRQPAQSRRGTAKRSPAAEHGPLFTLTIFGALLGAVLGIILAVPLSPAAAITEGQPSPVTIDAPQAITYESEVRTRQAQEAAEDAADNIAPIIDPDVQPQQRANMLHLFQRVGDVRADDSLSQAQRAAAIAGLGTVPMSAELAQQIVQLPEDRWQLVTDEARRLYDEIWRNRTQGLSESDVEAIRERELPYTRVAPTLDDAQRQLVLFFVDSFLRPNRTIDQEATAARRAAARATVEPVQVTIANGENIVREGDVVNAETYEKLQKLGLVFGVGGSVAIFQKWLLGLLAAWLFTSYIYRYQLCLWRNRRGLVVIGAGMAAFLLAARLLVPLWNSMPFAFPLAALAILLTVLFDGRVGLLAALTIAPLIGLQTEQSVGLTFTLALGSAAGVFLAQRAVRSVSFVGVGLGVALLTMLGALVFWLNTVDDWPAWLSIVAFSTLNGAGSSVLALGTYQLLGRVANVVTPLQLMELAHPNQPLLHRLMREAPGTYHHSIVVSNLAEVAAEDIGADPLLARVGAYYHDVGKMLRPYFFTDNQHERSNVHDNLDAKTSATIIIDHVREGAKLAKEHGLPEQVIDFIRQHHGTNLVSFFYQRALREDSESDIEDFRYPGPKPQTREDGIMMLADGVEATVRAKAQSGKLRPVRPDEDADKGERGLQSIAEVVDQIVTERVQSGQLDECPLTLRDIAIIKESFVKTLQGIYHPRVEYPQPRPAPAVEVPVLR